MIDKDQLRITHYASRIGIDASRALQGIRTGTEHYSANLLRALAQLPEAGAQQFICYVNSTSGDAEELFGYKLPPNFAVRPIPFRRLWTHMRLSAEMIGHPPGVLFVPAHVIPLGHPPRSVVTIHDLGYLYFPQAHTRASRLYLHWSTLYSARVARRIIAVSDATANDLLRRYHVPKEKISVVLHGVDERFRPVEDASELARVRAQYELGQERPYILFVGTLQPRKNLGRLVAAFAALRRHWDDTRGPFPLLALGGKKGWLYDELFAQVERLGLGADVRFLGYVADEDLPALISGATVFALPSLYEGFGMPALEAMACGTPLVAAAGSSLPEVVGDAGLLVDPYDVPGWTTALARLLGDAALRRELAQRGRARAALFTWERCAGATLAVLQEAGAHPGGQRRG